MKKIISMKLLFVNTLLIALILSSCGGDNSDRETSKNSKELNEVGYINLHKGRIKNRLKDSESAKFRNIFISKKIGSPIVCGEINSKNSFGGYSGYQRFVSGGTIQVIESDMAKGEMDSTWLQVCGK